MSFTENMTHAQTVCTRPFLLLLKGPGDEAKMLLSIICFYIATMFSFKKNHSHTSIHMSRAHSVDTHRSTRRTFSLTGVGSDVSLIIQYNCYIIFNINIQINMNQRVPVVQSLRVI